jgi:hypothetical protein
MGYLISLGYTYDRSCGEDPHGELMYVHEPIGWCSIPLLAPKIQETSTWFFSNKKQEQFLKLCPPICMGNFRHLDFLPSRKRWCGNGDIIYMATFELQNLLDIEFVWVCYKCVQL